MTTEACLKDFMLVGNGNAFDSAGVKIRENCKLGQIPAYVVSPQAVDAKYQVQASPVPSDEINNGAMRLLAAAYPVTKAGGVGIGSSTLSSIIPTGLKAQEYLKDIGVKVAVLQQQPVQVDNYRPYIEQLKTTGAKGFYQISAQDPTPIVQAMKNVGYTPDWVLYSVQFYGPQAISGAKALGTFPPQNLVTGEASPCVALVRLTTDGFVYDQKVTSPTPGDGPFNCDPQNVKHVKTYVTGS